MTTQARTVARESIGSSVAASVTVGSGGGSGYAPLTGLPLDSIEPIVAVGLQYLGGTGNGQAWADARYPTVNVEKGYGSTVFQDLYPDPTTGELFTKPNGGGQTATDFADGDKLFVQTPYNQALSDPDASGHPTPITDASRRVFLDLTVPTCPVFAGISQGAQDASQHATERGYDLNVSVVSNQGTNALAFDCGVGSTDYRPFNNNGGSSQGMLVNPSNARWYDNAVVSLSRINPTTRPNVKGWFINRLDRSPTTSTMIAVQGAFMQSSGAFTVNSTSTPMRVWGAALPLNGKGLAVVMWNGESEASVVNQAIKRMHFGSSGLFGAAELSLYGPKISQGFPIDLGAGTGTIYIECASGANREIEASFNGSAYQSIGTTDSNGYLAGTFTNASPGKGTLSVRVVGQATVGASVANVTVGVFVVALGQSNALGRGDDYTFSPTIGATLAAGDWSNIPTTTKSWIVEFGKQIANDNSAPIVYHNSAAGATYLYFNTGGSTDGRHGHWSPINPGTSTTNNFADSVRQCRLIYGHPNFVIWHQGESEAADNISAETYEAALVAFWTEFKSQTGLTGKLWIMQIGRDGSVADDRVDAIRKAQVDAVANNPALFELGGCLAHLPVENALDAGQNVHFYTTAQKDAVIAVFKRHALGAGRGPRFSSMTASGTTITITCTGGVSPLTIDTGEASSPIGWTVSDGVGSKTVTAVSVSGLTITLTVNSSLSGTVNVKWLSHFTGIGTTLLDSDAITPIPPEPFEQSVTAT